MRPRHLGLGNRFKIGMFARQTGSFNEAEALGPRKSLVGEYHTPGIGTLQ